MKNTSRFYVGLADSTDDNVKLYIADSLRTTVSCYETDATLKINCMLQLHDDSIKKMEIMSSIFTGICIKTINGINIIEVSEDIFNLRSSN